MTGLLLSTALAGCAHPGGSRPAAPAAIAVDTHVAPSAELLVCPTAPEGFPEGAEATMPVPVRFAVIRLARAFREQFVQLERLIGFETGTPCSAEEAGK